MKRDERLPGAICVASRAHLLAGFLAMVSLVGCQTTTQITADDSKVSLPSFRAAVSLSESSRPPSELQSGHAFEFSLNKAQGSGEQALALGEPPVVLNNTTFNAPQQLSHKFDIGYADISYRWRKFFLERSLGLDISGGLGYSSLDLAVASATQRAAQKFGNYGAQGGVGLIWRMRPNTGLHARVSGFASSADTGLTNMGRYELFLSQGLGDHLALRAGYAKWEVNGDAGAGSSDFRLTFSGPRLELGLAF